MSQPAYPIIVAIGEKSRDFEWRLRNLSELDWCVYNYIINTNYSEYLYAILKIHSTSYLCLGTDVPSSFNRDHIYVPEANLEAITERHSYELASNKDVALAKLIRFIKREKII